VLEGTDGRVLAHCGQAMQQQAGGQQ